MKRNTSLTILMMAVALPLAAQIQIGLDNLASKAKESVNISLDSAMLKLAGNFFAGSKAQDPGFQKVLAGLKSITVKSYTFTEEGQYRAEDLEPVRAQLRSAGWGSMLAVHDKRGGAEIYTKSEGGQIAGITVLATEPKELSVVSIEGAIDLSKLADLAGHFGIPALVLPGQKTDQRKKGTDQ